MAADDEQNSTDNELNAHTRDIYHAQHTRIGEDESARTRLMGITDEKYFQVEPGFFSGKKILDCGCGSIVRNAIAFHQMGARDITAMDLGEEWHGTARKNMDHYQIPHDEIKFTSGNVIDLPFGDEEFDFVCCDGVITHLADPSQVEQTISELSRITRRGGHLYTSFMAGGGIVETRIHDALRDAYTEDHLFSEFVDNIKPEMLWAVAEFINEKMIEKTGESFDRTLVKSFLDEDFCISIQNTCQAKKRETHSISYINRLLAGEGFEEPRRLKRYVKRSNIRKFMAPFHYFHDHTYSKILYGDGWVDCIARKHA